MKLLLSALAVSVLALSAPAQAATQKTVHHVHHMHVVHHYHHHYYAGGSGYYGAPPPPPPGYYSPWDQPLYGATGIVVGEPNWGNRTPFKLLMQSIHDRPFDD